MLKARRTPYEGREGVLVIQIGWALLPILVILLLLFGLKQTASRAGGAACLAAIGIAVFVPGYHLDLAGLGHAAVKGALTALIVAYVLLFGIWLFHLMNERKLIHSIAEFVAASTQDPVRQVLVLGVAFSPLVESASGFGLAVIVVAPILVSLGFKRRQAALISLLSLSAVPWGALATGTVIGAKLAGLPLKALGTGSAWLCLPTFFYFAILAVIVTGGLRALRQRLGEVLGLTGVLALSVWLYNQTVSVELAGVLGALTTLLVELAFLQAVRRRTHQRVGAEQAQASAELSAAGVEAGERERLPLLRAISPYLFLSGILFLTHLLPSVEAFCQSHLILDLPSYSFRLPLLYSPGGALLLTCVFTVLLFRIRRDTIVRCWRLTLKQWVPVNLSTLAFVVMAEVMAASGMTSELAQAAAGAFGSAFLLLAPLVGGLGGFLTGSNTGSNAMFIPLQVEAAHQLHLPPELFAAAQNTAASHLSMASPSRVLLGVSVLGIREEENWLIRRMAWVGLGTLFILIAGVLALSSFS
jgi:lactate permease